MQIACFIVEAQELFKHSFFPRRARERELAFFQSTHFSIFSPNHLSVWHGFVEHTSFFF